MLHVEERILVSEVAKLKKQREEKKASSTSQSSKPSPEGTPAVQDTNSATSTPTPSSASADDEAYFAALEAGYAAHEGAQGEGNVTPMPNPSPIERSESNPYLNTSSLYPKERLLAQQLIRHGEKIMYIDADTHQEVTVIEYVASEFELDELTFTTPLFDKILQELKQHYKEPGFTAERYFITHADPEVSRLAVDLIGEKYHLSKSHQEAFVSEEKRLYELVLHLMVDYKHSIVEMELKDTLDQLRQPEVMADSDKCLEVMSRYKQLVEIKQHLAKHLGDRVIG